MNNRLSLPVDTEGRILQITDTHLFADPNNLFLGVDVRQSFLHVINEIKLQQRHYDLIVATGDLTQDQSQQAYQFFAEQINALNVPCVWLSGNHDDYDLMQRTLCQGHIVDDKVVLLGEHWLVILLNSQVAGAAYGWLAQNQLDFLASYLAMYPHRQALILLHHHPLPSGCRWLDQHSLHNVAEFSAVLAHYPLARTILCGHIHQTLDVVWQGRRVLASPATSIQFKPNSSNFALDEVAPGWRELTLYPDGRVDTDIFRINAGLFLPDMSHSGY